MASEIIYAVGTVKTLASSGAAIANGSLAQATTASYDVVADGSGFTDGEFVLTGTFATAPTEGTVLALYAQPLDVDGTLDAETPETTRPTMRIGTFVVNNVTTTQTIVCRGYDLPLLASYYIHNVNTGQQLSAGWTLKVKPLTKKVAP